MGMDMEVRLANGQFRTSLTVEVCDKIAFSWVVDEKRNILHTESWKLKFVKKWSEEAFGRKLES